MKKIIILSVLSAFIGILYSFVGIETWKENPGTIIFKTDAGMESTFTVRKWSFKKCDIKADAMEQLQVEAEMDMGSIDCSWEALEKGVKKKQDYFYIKKFPKATLKIDGAKKVKDNEYTCDAILTLKEISHPVVISFTTSTTDNQLKIKGLGTVNRRNHAFTGSGPKDEVPVEFEFVVK
jgi:polyisoprenoid-binding protein YceI